MKQLIHNLKNGDMKILEVPLPALESGMLMVRNHYSVISIGTEGKRIKDAKMGYLGKARSRKKEVKQVIDSIKTQGVVTTYRSVMNKLNSYSSLGYSCSGEVIKVGEDVREFQVGDRVACGGNTAVHGEIVALPKNLCVKVPNGVDLKHAAFATIISIALQGVRQADLRLGENCAVIGLGLLGLITVQLLKASGIQVIGIDIDKRQVDLAAKCKVDLALQNDDSDPECEIINFTKGFGVDAVIITAATPSNDPINLAGQIARSKGKVVVVGAVSTAFSRENYYQKELELRMSTSYGPGRYDSKYENEGTDYPIGYVRWTENRNMQAAVELIKSKMINLDPLISHIFKFDEATKAFQMIVDQKEPFSGVLLQYDFPIEVKKSMQVSRKTSTLSNLNIGFIGAGSFAQNFLLPNVRNLANLVGVATAHSHTSKNVADKFDFDYCTGDADQIIHDKDIDTIFIATRHNLHAKYVLKSLKQGKNVFVEKPLALTLGEFNEIQSLYSSIPESKLPKVMVGFNRRFSPHILQIKDLLRETDPIAITYVINAGTVPRNHWIQDPKVGGGRIIGEVCHFVDLTVSLTGSLVKSVYANVMTSPNCFLDTLAINLEFENGSIAAISYFSNGNKNLPKESLKIFFSNQVAVVENFSQLNVFEGNKVANFKLKKQDKGHKNEVQRFLKAIKTGLPTPIPEPESFHVSLVTFKILESIQKKQCIRI